MRSWVLPLVLIGVIALIVVVVVFVQRRWERTVREEADVQRQMEWTGDCPVSNPDTGAECQRQEIHADNHYRVAGGRMHKW